MVESCELNIGAHKNLEELDAAAEVDWREVMNEAWGSLILVHGLRL